MTLILDIDFDVFVNPVARNLDENGPRLQEDQYNIDNTESIIDYIHSNLRYDNWNRGSVQVHHVETLATIENEILTNNLFPPFDWVHIDAHDDLHGHWDFPPNSGNFLYRAFLNEWIENFTFVCRENEIQFPDYILNLNNETLKYNLDINGIVVPITFGDLYEYALSGDPDYVLLTLSPAFTPSSIDEIFHLVSQKFE